MQDKTLFFMLFTPNKYSQLEPVETTLTAYKKILNLTCTDGEDMHQALTRALGGGSPLIGSVIIQESETSEPVMRDYMSHRELAQILQARLDKYKIPDEEIEVWKPTAPTGTDEVHRARTARYRPFLVCEYRPIPRTSIPRDNREDHPETGDGAQPGDDAILGLV